MKQFIKRMALLFCAVLLIGALAATASAATVASGTCGENLTWVLDDQGTLTILGTGELDDYARYIYWNIYADEINSVVISEGVTSIGIYAFGECGNLISVQLPSSLVAIHDSAFYGCSNLEGIKIPDGVTTVGDWAFASCSNLTSIQLPKSITVINDYAFYGCSNLEGIKIPDGVTTVGDSAFAACSNLTSIQLPKSITVIKDFAFNECSSLESIVIPEGVTRVGKSVFVLCSSLTNVQLPESLEVIDSFAFNACSSLESIEIPEKVEFIGVGAFSVCYNLKSIYIPSNVTTIQEDAFSFCHELSRITVSKSNPKYASDDFGVLYDKSMRQIIQVPGGIKGTYKVDSDVKSVGAGAFEECYYLESVYFTGDAPEFLKEIYTIDGVEYVSDRNFARTRATIYYPADNPTWTEDVKQNYGGTLTWVPYGEAKVVDPTLKASNVASTGKIKLTWNQVDGAAKYEVYRATSKTGTYSLLKTLTGTSLTNTSTTVGKTYYYKIRAVDANGNKSDFSSIVSRTCDLPRPEVKVSNVSSSGKVKLTWTAVEGAAKYEVYRATSKDGTYSLLKTLTGTSLTNTSTTAGTTYYYKVKAIHSNSAANSAYSSVVSRACDLPQPTGLTATNVASSGKVKLSWTAVEGAAKYEIYRATSKDGTYSKLSTTTNTTLTNTSTTAGTTYYYKVKAIHSNSAANSAYSSIVSRTCDLAQPTLTVKLNSSGKPVLTWTKVEGAVSYKVYRATSKDGTYSLLKTLTGTSLTNTSVTAGKTYYYKVIAIHSNTAANSAYSAIKSVTVK